MSRNLNEIHFDRFRLSLVERCLFRGDQLVPLTGKEYAILTALLESRGQVVQKDDLSEIVWPNTIVEESNLFHHIGSLRKKLGTMENGQSYIETIPGRGYRFLAKLEPETNPEPAVSEPTKVDLQTSTPEEPPIALNKSNGKGFAKWIAGLAALTVVAVGAFTFLHRRSPAAPSSAVLGILTSPETGSVPRLLNSIEVASRPSNIFLDTKRDELYVLELLKDSVAIIDVKSDRVVGRIAVGHQPAKLAPGRDGEKLLIAHDGGGVGVIDLVNRSFKLISDPKVSVMHIVTTPDRKSAYLALGFLGLGKLDLATQSVNVISKTVYVRALALTPDGRRLYVSYQASGPGGSPGHDAIGYFDTKTDRLAGSITGFANVGECLSVSPDGSQVWENGEDACDSPQYDHVGCPVVPGGLFNVFTTANNKLARAAGVRGARLACITFSPDGDFAAVGTTDHLLLIRSKDLAMITSLPIGLSGRLVFTPDGMKAHAPLNRKSTVAVIQVGEKVRVLRLTNREEPDQAFPLAIPSSPDFDAKTIDPTSLRLEGVPVQTTATGSLAASVEHVMGFAEHSLIVHFKINRDKAASKMTLVGKTYSGMPITGVVEPL